MEKERCTTLVKIYPTMLLSSFVIPLFLTFVIEWMHRGGLFKAIGWMAEHPVEAFFNYVITFALVNVMLVFSIGKLYFVLSSLLGVLLSMLAYVSYVKGDLRGEPLTILDFRLAGEAAAIAETLQWKYFVPLFGLGFAWIISLAIIKYVSKPFHDSRMPYVGIALLSSFILVYAHQLDIPALSKHHVAVPADVSWNHDQNGFLLATLVDSKFLHVPVPDGYGREAIKEVYGDMRAKADGGGERKEKPNVIFILGESFSVLSELADLRFNEEPTPFFKDLSHRALSGWIEVPGIGGGTANTEFEVLTGLSGKFINNYSVPYNPYSSYIHRPIHSLARIFSEQGYETAGFHSYHGWFYRRSEVYKHLGFHKFISLEHFQAEPEKAGKFTKDSVLYQAIIDEVNRTPNRNFISAITMQSHGPYNDVSLPEKPIVLETELSENGRITIENYANLLKGVDSSLKQLIQYFESFEEPTVIVFYADHIPPFGSELYKELNVLTYGERGKRVPVLIWSNNQDISGHIEMKANMLGAYVLERIGIVDTYMNYLNAYRRKSPYTDKTTEEAMHHDFELLHYDMMHGNQYIQEFAGELSAKENYEFGYTLEIDDVLIQERKNMYIVDILGSGFSWMSSLLVNSEEYTTMHEDGGRLTAFVPKEKLKEHKELRLQVQIKDTRQKTVKTSDDFIVSQAALSEAHSVLSGWRTVKLDGNLRWEHFDTRNNSDIVRVDVNLKDSPLYFVEREKLLLADSNADTMENANESDIYVNGYLYVSVSKADSGWKKKPTRDEMKHYFAVHPYDLHVRRAFSESD